jgi:hypothetical protein
VPVILDKAERAIDEWREDRHLRDDLMQWGLLALVGVSILTVITIFLRVLTW